MTDSCILPEFSLEQAAQLVRERYGLDGKLKPMDGERDLNFLVDCGSERYVFKIANAAESPAMLECQHAVFERLSRAQVFPHNVTARRAVNGLAIETIDSAQGSHACRVLPFVEGRMLSELEQFEPALLDDFGRKLARLDRALEGFDHPALERPLLWDLTIASDIVESYRPLLPNREQESLVMCFTDRFRQRVLPHASRFRRAVIHNDANRDNVVIDPAGRCVVCLIDFGDMIETWLAAEVAIASCYVMLGKPDPLDNALILLRGYHAELPLLDNEIDALFELICMRLCTSVCICAHQRRLAPDNAYLGVDEKDAWALLREIRNWDADATRERLRAACN